MASIDSPATRRIAMADRLSKRRLYQVLLSATSVMLIGALAIFAAAKHFGV